MAELPTAATAPKREALAGISGQVLVVDDDPHNRTLLADWLGANGHTVFTAPDGMAALRKVSENVPDCIVLDLMMPGLDGFAVCEQLKTDPATIAVPVIMLTASHEREDRLKGMRAGADDFLPKPADLADVLLRVRNAIHRKQLHDQAQMRLREISRQEQLKENLLHMIVHDLRTPLAGLEGYLQLLQMAVGTTLEERPAHYLRQSLHAAHNLAHHIDLLLDIHRMEEGRMPVQFVAHDLTDVVAKALETLRPLFANRQVRLERPAQPVIAMGDPSLVSRMVLNLVGNAIAFTAPNPSGSITVQVTQTPTHARVEIADNGTGIKPEHQQAIFDKFFQVGEQTKRRSSGLGLAFCKLAVEAQNGRIGVTSQPGSGSCFWFELQAK